MCSDFLIKTYIVGTHLNYLINFIKAYYENSFELPRFVEAIQRDTSTYGFIKEPS